MTARKIALALIFTTLFSNVAVACLSLHDAFTTSSAITQLDNTQTPADEHSIDVHCHECTSQYSCHMTGILSKASFSAHDTNSYKRFEYQLSLKNHSAAPPTKPPRV